MQVQPCVTECLGVRGTVTTTTHGCYIAKKWYLCGSDGASEWRYEYNVGTQQASKLGAQLLRLLLAERGEPAQISHSRYKSRLRERTQRRSNPRRRRRGAT